MFQIVKGTVIDSPGVIHQPSAGISAGSTPTPPFETMDAVTFARIFATILARARRERKKKGKKEEKKRERKKKKEKKKKRRKKEKRGRKRKKYAPQALPPADTAKFTKHRR